MIIIIGCDWSQRTGSFCESPCRVKPLLTDRMRMFGDHDIAAMDGEHACIGDELNGFAGVRHLSGWPRRRAIPQELGIVQGGWILGVALKNFLKLFEGIIKLLLFV